jgi:hypothetical protein
MVRAVYLRAQDMAKGRAHRRFVCSRRLRASMTCSTSPRRFVCGRICAPPGRKPTARPRGSRNREPSAAPVPAPVEGGAAVGGGMGPTTRTHGDQSRTASNGDLVTADERVCVMRECGFEMNGEDADTGVEW